MSSSPHAVPPIVLVVEDDPDTRNLYQTAFDTAGLWVAHAADAADGLEYAMDLRPDSVVMDIAIPSIEDGLTLARAFRQNPKTADTPLIAVTGVEPAKLNPYAGLFTKLFFKPVRLDHMVRQVTWLSSRSAVLRERSDRARARVPALLAKSTELLIRSSRLLERSPDDVAGFTEDASMSRTCPNCQKPLLFSERRSLDDTTFDYYAPCRAGCGLFCYDHSRRKMITLVG